MFKPSDFEKIDKYYSKSRKKPFTYNRLKNITLRNKQINDNYHKSLQELKFQDQDINISRNENFHHNPNRINKIQPSPPHPNNNYDPNHMRSINNTNEYQNQTPNYNQSSVNESHFISNQATKFGHFYRSQKTNNNSMNNKGVVPLVPKNNQYKKNLNMHEDNFKIEKRPNIVFVENPSSTMQESKIEQYPSQIYKNEQVINPNFYQEINSIKKRSHQEMSQSYNNNKQNDHHQIQNENNMVEKLETMKKIKIDNSNNRNEIQFKTLSDKPMITQEKTMIPKPNGKYK